MRYEITIRNERDQVVMMFTIAIESIKGQSIDEIALSYVKAIAQANHAEILRPDGILRIVFPETEATHH